MPRVVIATTMWGEVRKECGIRREQELKKDFWKDMLAHGCRTERFENTHASAWDIVGNLSEGDHAPVRLPAEIVDTRLRLNETQAGIALKSKLEKLNKDRAEAARRLRKQAKRHSHGLVVEEVSKEVAVLEQKIHQTADELLWMNSCGPFQG